MPSYTTVNKVDENGFISKYDVFKTREEADARIVELHQIAGYEDAFVVDNDATSVNGQLCFQNPNHFPVDIINKTVSFDQNAFDTDKYNKNMKYLRSERNNLLFATDIIVLPDRWALMDDATKAAWANYRQALRDLPANTGDNIILDGTDASSSDAADDIVMDGFSSSEGDGDNLRLEGLPAVLTVANPVWPDVPE